MSELIAPASPVLSDWLVLQTMVGQEPRVAERLPRRRISSGPASS